MESPYLRIFRKHQPIQRSISIQHLTKKQFYFLGVMDETVWVFPQNFIH